MASAAVRFNAVVLFCCCLFIVGCFSRCLWGFSVRPLFCCAVHCVLSSFAAISLEKRELVVFLLVYSKVIVLWLFLAVPWVGL